MEDVVPAMLERIQATFSEAVEADRAIQRVANRIRDGTATLEDAHLYAERIGTILSLSLQKHITEDALPDGKLYWNIADRTIRPTLERNYYLANDVAREIQAIIDAADGLGLSSVAGDLHANRIQGLVQKAATAPDFAAATAWLGEPIVNCTEAFVDDFVEANASFRAKAGMSVRIERKLGASEQRSIKRGKGRVTYHIPCEWCQNLAGSWPYGEHPENVYQRHEFCRCVTSFHSGRLVQDVYSKRWYTETGQSITNKDVNLDVFRQTPEEAEQLEKALAQEQRRADRQAARRARQRTT